MNDPRIPSINTPPAHPGTSQYTDYKPQPHSRVVADVRQVIANGSFISRVLGVISRDGDSKNFETITGQDGLTFGIKDFATDGGAHNFFKAINAAAPDKFTAAFGNRANDLLDESWIHHNNAGGHGSGANDAGLIRFDWLRNGLDQLLTDAALRPVQLEIFRKETVEPPVSEFNTQGFVFEFSLATMIAIANSRGVTGMKNDLHAALNHVGGSGEARENVAIKRLLETYVAGDPHPAGSEGALLTAGFGGASPSTLSEHGVGHRGRRAYALFTHFPYANNARFQALGEFSN